MPSGYPPPLDRTRAKVDARPRERPVADLAGWKPLTVGIDVSRTRRVLLGGRALLPGGPAPLLGLVGELARASRLRLGLRLATVGGFGEPSRLGSAPARLDALLGDAALTAAGAGHQGQR